MIHLIEVLIKCLIRQLLQGSVFLYGGYKVKRILLFLSLILLVQQTYPALARVPVAVNPAQATVRLPQGVQKHLPSVVASKKPVATQLPTVKVSTKQLADWAKVEPAKSSWATRGTNQAYLKGIRKPQSIHPVLRQHAPELWKKHQARMLKQDGTPKQVSYYSGDVRVGGPYVTQELHDEILHALQSARRAYVLHKRAPDFVKKHASKFLKKDGTAKKIHYDSSKKRFRVGSHWLPPAEDAELKKILASDLSNFLQGKNIFELLQKYAPELIKQHEDRFYKLNKDPKQISFDGVSEEFRIGGQVISESLNETLLKTLESARMFNILEQQAPKLLKDNPDRFYTKAGVPKKISYNIVHNDLRLGGQPLPAAINNKVMKVLNPVVKKLAEGSVVKSELTDKQVQEGLRLHQESSALVPTVQDTGKKVPSIHDYFRAQEHDQWLKSELRKAGIKDVPSALALTGGKDLVVSHQDTGVTPYAVGMPVGKPYADAPLVSLRKEVGIDPYKVGVPVGQPYTDDQLAPIDVKPWHWDADSLLPAALVVAGGYASYQGYKKLKALEEDVNEIVDNPDEVLAKQKVLVVVQELENLPAPVAAGFIDKIRQYVVDKYRDLLAEAKLHGTGRGKLLQFLRDILQNMRNGAYLKDDRNAASDLVRKNLNLG